LLFVLLILTHERRRVLHIAVTDHPTAACTAQQVREAFPWDEAPNYIVHDHDTAFHAWATTATAIGMAEVITAVRSPWQNAYAERLIGSIRRECLDHIIIANERGAAPRLTRLRPVLSEIPDASVTPQRCARPAGGRAGERRRNRSDAGARWP